jgi:pantoate--beta-alanine ligase
MYLFQRVGDLQAFLQAERANYRSVGFVPTMGALHEGHLALVKRAKAENQIAVCSIFVNPTQFNQAEDLMKYPRTPGKDIALLAQVGCDVLFFPTELEIYPPGLETRLDIDLAGLDTVMEGAHRPGHFAGVVQVVKRLLDLVQPHRLYLGQKDFQQVSVVRQMMRVLALPIELVMAPTVREADGLAMSSRNVRLSAEGRALAPKLYEALSQLRQQALKGALAPAAAEAQAIATLEQAGFRPEYVSIVDGHSLRPLAALSDATYVVVCAAAWLDGVRLIDNLVIKEK